MVGYATGRTPGPPVPSAQLRDSGHADYDEAAFNQLEVLASDMATGGCRLVERTAAGEKLRLAELRLLRFLM